jgi:hypothetical protein
MLAAEAKAAIANRTIASGGGAKGGEVSVDAGREPAADEDIALGLAARPRIRKG